MTSNIDSEGVYRNITDIFKCILSIFEKCKYNESSNFKIYEYPMLWKMCETYTFNILSDIYMANTIWQLLFWIHGIAI
jgi:hypothetical protein